MYTRGPRVGVGFFASLFVIDDVSISLSSESLDSGFCRRPLLPVRLLGIYHGSPVLGFDIRLKSWRKKLGRTTRVTAHLRTGVANARAKKD